MYIEKSDDIERKGKMNKFTRNTFAFTVLLTALAMGCGRKPPVSPTPQEAVRRDDVSDVKRHLQQGIDVNARDDNGRTLLSVATETGRVEIVEYLVSKGADINAKDNSGQTPLHHAAIKGDLAMVKHLVESGADIKAKDIHGAAPLDYAVESGAPTEVIEYLKSKGADE